MADRGGNRQIGSGVGWGGGGGGLVRGSKEKAERGEVRRERGKDGEKETQPF